MSNSVGSYLKRERELRRIPLEEISEQTRIKLEYLEAIESEHFEKIPGLIFAKGYLRSYAEYVGLNPEEVVLRFEALLSGLSGDGIPERPRRSLRLFWLVTFLILILSATSVILWLRR
jgi:cytoskeletal protein RodZ